jgi:outer membrane murein-binding lipoprotein Lpp
MSKTPAPGTTGETKAVIKSIVGTGIGLATLLLMLAGLIIQQNANVNARIDDVNANVNARIDDVNANVNARIDDVNASVNARIDDLRSDIRDLRADHVRFDERLDALGVAFGKVDQRLATLERLHLPSPDAGE